MITWEKKSYVVRLEAINDVIESLILVTKRVPKERSTFVKNQVHISLKGEPQRENKLTLYERAFRMLENDMYIAGIAQSRSWVIKL